MTAITQEIGYGYLIPQTQNNDDAAYKQTIAQMPMQELKRMMCPKSGGDPLKCMECSGLKSCTAGQRAVRILDDEARKKEPQYIKKFPESKPQDEAEKVSNNPTSQERDLLKRACESGNAWHFLMVNKGLSKDAAGEFLSKLIKKFPGVAADFGGSRRIMQRPKVVKFTGTMTESQPDAHPAAPVAQEQADTPKVDKIPVQKEEGAEGAKEAQKQHRTRAEFQQDRAEKALAYAKMVAAQENPKQYLMETEGLTPRQATKKLGNMRARWPEAFQTLTERTQAKLATDEESRRKLYEECMASDDPVAHYMQARGTNQDAAKATLKNWKQKYGGTDAVEEKKETPVAAQDNDQISLDDFLHQMGMADAPEPQQPPENEHTPAESSTANELLAKYEQLDAEKRQIEERIRWIEEQQDALTKVIQLIESTAIKR